MKYWFTADHHFGHANIIEYCKRPFNSVFHMDSELIRRWNEKVSKEDTVIYLGDFCLAKEFTSEYYRKQLNGEIIFLKGSHDNRNKNSLGFKPIISSIIINYGGLTLYCSHEPDPVMDYNLCGHVHEKWKLKEYGAKVVLNVGIDQWNFYPIDISQIVEIFRESKKQKKSRKRLKDTIL